MTYAFSEIALRTRLSDEAIQTVVGKILTDDAYDLLLNGPTAITIPDGKGGRKQLLKYLPGAFAPEEMASFYDVLHELKSYETTNRGNASGTVRQKAFEDSTWTYSKPVASAIIGAFDAAPPKNYCRLTAFTGKENEKFASLFPLFEKIGALFGEHVPERYQEQMRWVRETPEDWVVPGTPFTTITVNNTYPTGVHTDKGDLDEGFSTLAVLRRGQYLGGRLVFPQWRVAADLQDGDLLLMDAHQWHGNTAMELLDPECYVPHPEPTKATWRLGVLMGGGDQIVERVRELCDEHANALRAEASEKIVYQFPVVPAERISVVSYYRTRMKECGTAEDELKRAEDWAERRTQIGAAAVEEMAAEAVG